MKILLDMNLSPKWVQILQNGGHQAIHWSNIGKPHAPDTELLSWAKNNNYLLMTHDLDFTAILAATQAEGPSVLQLRSQDILPS